MPGPYASLSDDDLVALRDEYLAAKKSIALGGALAVIAGEGRRKEFTKANPGTLQTDLREILAEIGRRPSLSGLGGYNGGSLGLTFGRDY